ncbi:MAG: hypothetical protein ABSF67_02725 [Roseiarcus sp.]
MLTVIADLWLLCLAAFLCLAAAAPEIDCADAADLPPLIVSQDVGGTLAIYALAFDRMRQIGLPVAVDGLCASACTLVFELPDAERCATWRAAFAFHRASAPIGDAVLWAAYSAPLKARLGELHPWVVTLRAPEIFEFIRPCPPLARDGST